MGVSPSNKCTPNNCTERRSSAGRQAHQPNDIMQQRHRHDTKTTIQDEEHTRTSEHAARSRSAHPPAIKLLRVRNTQAPPTPLFAFTSYSDTLTPSRDSAHRTTRTRILSNSAMAAADSAARLTGMLKNTSDTRTVVPCDAMGAACRMRERVCDA